MGLLQPITIVISSRLTSVPVPDPVLVEEDQTLAVLEDPAMASLRAVSRLASRLQSQPLKLKNSSFSSFQSASQSQLPASSPRVSRLSRLPVELSSLVTMLPLHSAIATSRLTSSLSIESQSWGLVPQGISMPL